MFCALYGATRTPRRTNARHSPVVTTLLPASDVVPATSSPLMPGSSRAHPGRPQQADVHHPAGGGLRAGAGGRQVAAHVADAAAGYLLRRSAEVGAPPE